LVFEEGSADSQFRFSLTAKESKLEGNLKRLAVGHYQAALPSIKSGEYRIDLVEDRRGRRISYPALGYTQPYEVGAEQPRTEANIALLSRLAEVTGGAINVQATESASRVEITKSYQPIRQPLIILSFLLFLLEIIARRFFFSDTE
jgi:hypothetical protein